jgi:hypothetical protein
MKKRVSKPEEPVDSPQAADEKTPPPPAPHPLTLNSNEGRWFNLCEGPCNGWFSFGDHGNPPFDIPVQVCVGDGADAKAPFFTVVGIRTRVIDEAVGKERWALWGQFPIPSSYGALYWRPLSVPPR